MTIYFFIGPDVSLTKGHTFFGPHARICLNKYKFATQCDKHKQTTGTSHEWEIYNNIFIDESQNDGFLERKYMAQLKYLYLGDENARLITFSCDFISCNLNKDCSYIN